MIAFYTIAIRLESKGKKLFNSFLAGRDQVQQELRSPLRSKGSCCNEQNFEERP